MYIVGNLNDYTYSYYNHKKVEITKNDSNE